MPQVGRPHGKKNCAPNSETRIREIMHVPYNRAAIEGTETLWKLSINTPLLREVQVSGGQHSKSVFC